MAMILKKKLVGSASSIETIVVESTPEFVQLP